MRLTRVTAARMPCNAVRASPGENSPPQRFAWPSLLTRFNDSSRFWFAMRPLVYAAQELLKGRGG